MTFTPSRNIERLSESATIAVSQRARALRAQGRRIIDLGVGEPDFDTPAFIRDAAHRAIEEGHTRYTATDGIPPLRQAVADNAAGICTSCLAPTPAEVVVSNGSKQSIFNACVVLFGPDDEVLVPTPSWTSYYEIVQLARATPVQVPGDPSNGLKVPAGALVRAATARTRGLILNSPCNPTGAVYSADELRDILALARRRGWWVISDEIYRRIAYNGDATSALQVATDRDTLVVVDGVAKAYAMTGWRVGWSIAPRAVSAAMTAFQSHATFHTASISQWAALAALTHRDEADAAVAAMVAEYRRRRDAALEVLRRVPDLPVVPPEGAFYLYLHVAGFDPDEAAPGSAFATRLLDEKGLAVVPGAAFRTPEWVRMSYAARIDQVIEGAECVASLWEARHGQPAASTTVAY